MPEKIRGEFLKIEDEGERFHIQFIDENGNIDGVRLGTDLLSLRSYDAIIRLEQLKKDLLTATDKTTITQIKDILVVFQFQALWPQMYIAYCRGEDLGRFFTIRKARGMKSVENGRTAKKVNKRRKSKSQMRGIYNSIFKFHQEKGAEFEKKYGTKYGAAKYADEETVKEIKRLYHINVSSKNVRDAMNRN